MDKRFSGTVKLPYVPRPRLKLCMLGDAAHCEEARSLGLDAMSVDELKLLKKDKKLVKKLAALLARAAPPRTHNARWETCELGGASPRRGSAHEARRRATDAPCIQTSRAKDDATQARLDAVMNCETGAPSWSSARPVCSTMGTLVRRSSHF